MRHEKPGHPKPSVRRLLAESVGFLCIPVVLALLAGSPATRGFVVYIANYKPIILGTRPEALLASAFYEPHITMIGPTTLFTAALFVPYALIRGFGRSVVVYFSGHVISTLAVVAVVIPMDADGAHWATRIVHMSDVGASAGLAACAGGLAVYTARRFWPVGVPVLVFLYGFFGHGVVYSVGLNRLSDVEHLIALSVGVVLEIWWDPITQRALRAGSWVQRRVMPDHLAGAGPAPTPL